MNFWKITLIFSLFILVSGCIQDDGVLKEAGESCAVFGETFCNNTTFEIEGEFFNCTWLTEENRCTFLTEKLN